MNPSRLPAVSTISLHMHNILRVSQANVASTKTTTSPKQVVVTFAHANGFCKEVWLPVMQNIQDNIRSYLTNSLPTRDTSDKVIDLVLTSVDLNGSGDTPLRHDLVQEERWNAKETEVGWFNMGIDVLSAMNKSLSLVNIQRETNKPITIGVGHSMGGAATLHAEYAYPGSFNRMVLFEPVFFEQEFLDLADENGYASFNPLYDMTLKRKNWFPSKQAALNSYKGRGMFAKWNEDSLKAYVHGGFRPDIEKGSGITLKCAKEVEANRYLTTHRMGLKEYVQKIKSSIDLSYGELSTHFIDEEQTKIHFENYFKHIVNKGSKSTQVIKNTTHFLVMEDVETVSNIIMESISKAIAADNAVVQAQQFAKL